MLRLAQHGYKYLFVRIVGLFKQKDRRDERKGISQKGEVIVSSFLSRKDSVNDLINVITSIFSRTFAPQKT
jgi:hypothetical protein